MKMVHHFFGMSLFKWTFDIVLCHWNCLVHLLEYTKIVWSICWNTLMTLTHFLNDVNSAKETWNVVVRVLRLWCVQDFTKQKIPFSLEMVLQDEEVSFSKKLSVLTNIYFSFVVFKDCFVFELCRESVYMHLWGGLLYTNFRIKYVKIVYIPYNLLQGLTEQQNMSIRSTFSMGRRYL